jgi:hypothetical protein
MTIQKPIKFISCKILSVLQDSLYGIAPFASVPYKWTATLQLTAQPHFHPTIGNNNNGYFYNGADVRVGDYVATSAEGKILKIASISSVSSTSVNVTLEDENLHNYLIDGEGLIPNGSSYGGFIFEVVNGKAILSGSDAIAAMPANMPGSALSAINSRFARDEIDGDVTAFANTLYED